MAETFYSQIAANRRNSILLALIVSVLFAALGFSIGYAISGTPTGALGVMVFALVLAAALSAGSYFGGDKLVLATSGAKEVDSQSAPQLMNVVQEMALAAGVPMPKVYVIEDTAPNAFATGRDPKHASIAVTKGLLEKLDRTELEGVIAHEMSHIQNRDIRVMLLVTVLVGTVALISDGLLRGIRFGGGRRDRDRGGSGGAIIAIVAIALAILTPVIATLIQLAVSRQREYLADASGAMLTRYPPGLASALRKIAGDTEALEVANKATASLYIANPLKDRPTFMDGLFDTHPPIAERIKRLEAMG